MQMYRADSSSLKRSGAARRDKNSGVRIRDLAGRSLVVRSLSTASRNISAPRKTPPRIPKTINTRFHPDNERAKRYAE